MSIVLTGLGTATLSFGGNDRKTYGWAPLFGCVGRPVGASLVRMRRLRP
jgi:hypothetical protein